MTNEKIEKKELAEGHGMTPGKKFSWEPQGEKLKKKGNAVLDWPVKGGGGGVSQSQ